MASQSASEKRAPPTRDSDAKRTTKKAKLGHDKPARSSTFHLEGDQASDNVDDSISANSSETVSSARDTDTFTQVAPGAGTVSNHGASVNTVDDAALTRQAPNTLSNDAAPGVEVVDASVEHPSHSQVGSTVKGERVLFKAVKVTALARLSMEHGVRFNGVRDTDHLPFCYISDYFTTNCSKSLRLLRYASDGTGHNMCSIFAANPSDYVRVITNTKTQSRRVVHAEPTTISPRTKLDATFFVVGRVTRSDLLYNAGREQYSRDISIQPIHRFLPRSLAAIAAMLDFRRPLFNIVSDGILFSTARKPSDNNKGPNIKDIAMNNITHGPSPRAWDQDVPIFDGRSRFQLTRYTEEERLDMDLDEGDFALVAFTVGGWRDSKLPAVDPKSERVSLNVQFAILLERPNAQDQYGVSGKLTNDLRDETPLGVKDTTFMKPLLPDEMTDIELAAQTGGDSTYNDGPAM